MKKVALVALVLAFSLFVLMVLFFIFPKMAFQWQTRRWEAQIKQNEDPEKLRSWAKELLQRYKSDAFNSRSIATNFPPIGVRIQHEFTLIYYSKGDTNRQATLDPTQDYVNVESDFGAWTGAWGLKIGETNFVSSNPKDSKWKPGIYFFRFSGG